MTVMKDTLIKDFTAGIIPKQILLFSLPFMASNALQFAYSLVDMAVVGRYIGNVGLSAVSISSLLINSVTMLVFGFSSGG